MKDYTAHAVVIMLIFAVVLIVINGTVGSAAASSGDTSGTWIFGVVLIGLIASAIGADKV